MGFLKTPKSKVEQIDYYSKIMKKKDDLCILLIYLNFQFITKPGKHYEIFLLLQMFVF